MTDFRIDRTLGFQLGGVDETERAFTRSLGEELYSSVLIRVDIKRNAQTVLLAVKWDCSVK